MRTLLSLFFVPYLKVLGKFHLMVIVAFALILALQIVELVAAAPVLYFGSLYFLTTYHMFKENISWMLSSFNKKTLIKYHLLAQTLSTAIVLVIGSIGVLIFGVTLVLLSPDMARKQEKMSQSHPVAQQMKVANSSEQGSTQEKINEMVQGLIGKVSSTREQSILAVFVLFWLSTMYTPRSMKQNLRDMENKTSALKIGNLSDGQRFAVLYVAVLLIGFAFIEFAENLRGYMPVIMSFILVGIILWNVKAYNKTFVLFHPRYWKKIFAAGFTMAVVLSFIMINVSHKRFHTTKLASQKLSELEFMGAFAPALSGQQIFALAKEADAEDAMEILFASNFKGKVPHSQIAEWAGEHKNADYAFEFLRYAPTNIVLSATGRPAWQRINQELSQQDKKHYSKVISLFRDLHQKGIELDSKSKASWTKAELAYDLYQLEKKDARLFHSAIVASNNETDAVIKDFYNRVIDDKVSDGQPAASRLPASDQHVH